VYGGQRPFYEVWFGKLNVSVTQAFWFRYTLLDGAIQEAATWAIWFETESDTSSKIIAGKNRYELKALALPSKLPSPLASENLEETQEPPPQFLLGPNRLGKAYATGRAQALEWDLTFRDSGRRFCHVPWAVKMLRLAKAHYTTPFADLRFRGTIRVGNRTVTVTEAPGMIGHICGTRQGHSWAWAHCNTFEAAPNVVFEGLSARIILAGKPTMPLSSFVLWVEHRCYRFCSSIKLAMARSTFGAGRWVFAVKARGVSLAGEVIAPADDQLAIVEYTDTDASRLWCRNSKLASVRLKLHDPKHGIDREFVANGTAAFELVDRVLPEQSSTL
ncbi:MAG: hypothetical protein HY692_08840, partial [Cyanobacteria bacterium NC_groundwater_1444_Ag_S-0.65um_54_12]|nr:hypothetical protein [Cyanobacteria bacterium NC_groundwater_1444_Ag_S-0.65um_54_12]